MIIEVKMFVIRIVVFFIVVGLLIAMFAAFSKITQSNELERKLNELGESMLVGEFTISRGVFDPQKRSATGKGMADINNTIIEPISLCEHYALFEFLVDKKVVYRFGVKASSPISREWTVWLNTPKGIVPAKMRVTLSGSEEITDFLRLTCAIKQAWTYKRPVNLTAVLLCPGVYDCRLSYSRGEFCSMHGDVLTATRECRYLEGIPLGYPGIFESGLRKGITVWPIKDVGNAIDFCPPPVAGARPTTFESDEDRKKYGVKKILICDLGPAEITQPPITW